MDLSFLRPKVNPGKKMRIVLTGGGSGGHIFTLIAVIRELKKLAITNNFFLEMIYLGPDDFVLPYIIKEGIGVKKIFAGKLRRSFSLENFLDFFKTIAGIFQSFFYLYFLMPEVVFSKGGYGSFPVVLGSFLFFIPVYIHESDAVPGLVNHLTGKFAKRIFISFEYTKKYFPASKTILVGNPVRAFLLSLEANKENTKKLLGLSLERPTVIIIGGSQGAKHLNDLVLDIIPKIIDKVEIIHQTGKNNFNQVKGEAEVVFREIIGSDKNKSFYHPVPFFEETPNPSILSLRDVFLASDLIIVRAGSGLLFEVAAFGKPSIVIPLPWASRDHQKINAYEYARNGAAVVVEESNLKPNIFSELILQIISNKERQKKMSEAAFAFAKPESAKQIANYLINMA